MRTCTKCGESKPASEFKSRNGCPVGYCIPCRKLYDQQYNLRPEIQARRRIQRSMDTGTNRAKRRIYSYGLEQEMFDNLLREQGEVCAICGNPQRLRLGKPQELHVDHDHVTGEVRGLLCTWCNTRLGWLEQYLYPILTYLMRSTRWGNDLHDWAMHEVETHDLQQPTDLYI